MLQTSMVNVVRPSWISKLEPYNGMWHVSENGKPQGQFDIIIIAHNGEFLLPSSFFSSEVCLVLCLEYKCLHITLINANHL